MKKQIRFGVFETNSSSVHTMTILPIEEYEKLKMSGMLYDATKREVITTEEAIKRYNEAAVKYGYEVVSKETEDLEEWLRDSDYYTLYDLLGGDYYESYSEKYTSKSGDQIMIFGYSGFNG